MAETVEKKTSGFGTAGLVLGIMAIIFSFIPIISYLAFILGGLAFIFSVVSLIKRASKGVAIAGLILAIIAIFMANAMHEGVKTAVNDFSNSLDTMTGINTDAVLKDYLDVSIGKFEVDEDEFVTNTKLVVTLKNKSSEKKSFDVKIEAVDKDGNRIDDDTAYVSDLGAGQSQKKELFTLITSDKVKEYKNAKFKIVEASMY